MKAEFINPFLESAVMVLEQVVQIKPQTGPVGLKELRGQSDFIWIQIQLFGQVSGDIVFGMSEVSALKIVSAMMGGFQISSLDDMGKSAISELSNMISGNASTKLSSQGVHVDITPPALLQGSQLQLLESRKALTVPVFLDGIGQMDIQVLLAS
ncbi:Chemotaxis protein CheX [Paenibacillus pasadenensis]|uniref:Chemotaxis protein CheX n=1 Tax=Paenibacillus pasadenensis TaxID=217090 RepID=A0A2N5N454_9BACL|nr:chemotaxis protein CheX [Paenibacillus pasadenensis]PLT45113.1 Chemotaxis protein CheX [Paenibacillus pasadenensis]